MDRGCSKQGRRELPLECVGNAATRSGDSAFSNGTRGGIGMHVSLATSTPPPSGVVASPCPPHSKLLVRSPFWDAYPS